jgi:aspartyl-tRNA(Asn)/glutamyl-tRNA(Gln) amidotransferase subunit A
MSSLTRREFGVLTIGAAAARFQRVEAAQAPVAVTDLTSLSLTEASARIRARATTPTQLVQACLARTDIYNRKLNAYITVMRDQALAQARELDAEQAAGRLRGPLHGIPIALEDNIDTVGTRTTAASAVFDERVPTGDAEVTRRLKAAGAIVIGKANLHEFAMGGTSATSYYGPVRNPWALDRSTGGSSGGSAAAVSAGLCFGALGTDTGGSIRTPAAHCGVVGLKPSYGLVSIRGVVPLTLSLDHCGPIAGSVEDAAMMLNVLAGYDRLDIASVEHPKEDYLAALKQPVSGFKLGIPRAPFFDLLDDDVAKAVGEAIGVLAKMTGGVKDVTLPPTSDIALPAEAYAYHEEFISSTPNRYMLPTRRTLQGRTNLKASEYVRARWRLDLLRRTIDDSFSDVDLVVLPTRRRIPRTVTAAIKREDSTTPSNPELENTTSFNVYGIPAISVPCGFTTSGIPIGLMIAGPRFSEGRVLALARAYEQATEWHKRKPKLSPDMPVPPLAATDEQ